MGDTSKFELPSVRYKGVVLFVGSFVSPTEMGLDDVLLLTTDVFADCFRRFPGGNALKRHERLVQTARFLSAWARGQDYERRDLGTIPRDEALEQRILVAFLRAKGQDVLERLFREARLAGGKA
jgi:hypothetical protein